MPASFSRAGEALEELGLQLRLELRVVPRRGDEVDRQQPPGLHVGDALHGSGRRPRRPCVMLRTLRSMARPPSLLLGQQPRPRRLLVAALGQLDLPGVRRGQLALDELPPQLGLIQRSAGFGRVIRRASRSFTAFWPPLYLASWYSSNLRNASPSCFLTCLASGSSLLSFQ